MVAQRPLSAAETVLRRRIYATDTTIPVMTTDPFTTDARKVIGEEYVRCTGFGVDSQGQSVMTGCERGISREDGGSEAQSWPGGTVVAEVGWTDVEILTEIPEPTAAMAGREVVVRNPNGTISTSNIVLDDEDAPILQRTDSGPSTFGVATSTAGEFFSLPGPVVGLAVDTAGNLYTAEDDGATRVVRKFNSTFVHQWGTSVGTALGQIATDGTNVFVVEPTMNTVAKFLCSSGAANGTIGTAGSGNGQFNQPRGVTTAAGNLWVVDSGNNRIQRFATSTGGYIDQFGTSGSGDGQFNAPTGVTRDALGNLYIVDTGNHRVQRFTSSQVFDLAFGVRGNGDGQFNAPTGIAVYQDIVPLVLVADTGNHRVQLLEQSGTYITAIGAYGAEPDLTALKYPGQLAIVGQIVYIADRNNLRVTRCFFVESPAGITPVITTRTATSASISNTNAGNVTATCNAGEVVTGGGCVASVISSNIGIGASRPNGTTGWYCEARNNSGSSITVTAHAVCLQVPLS